MAVRTLLLEEMKRAIAIMEAKPELKKAIPHKDYPSYNVTDKEIVELRNLFHMIRKHSITVEKEEITW